MATYRWEGITRGGEARRGTIEAVSEEAAASRLRADGITPRVIKPALGVMSIQIGSGVTTRDLLVFTRQLSTMIDAGLPLVQCLDILTAQAGNKTFARVIHNVKTSVESGASFSEALRRHPRVFDDLYVNLVAAGEAGGILDTILSRLATYIEKASKLRGKVKSAMTYPLTILSVAVIVILVMLVQVIPTFEDMYKEFRGATLPAPTQLVIGLSRGFLDYWYIYAGALAASLVTLSWLLRSGRGRVLFDAGVLRVPIIGPVLRKAAVARFTRTLGTLLSSGVPILDALDICSRTAGNRVVQRALVHARHEISAGKDMATPLAGTGVFPPMVVQMIGVGEQTGALDQMLQKVADFYEDEVDNAVTALTSMLEPIMMVFLGAVVGGLIIAMYLPVFELAGNINAD